MRKLAAVLLSSALFASQPGTLGVTANRIGFVGHQGTVTSFLKRNNGNEQRIADSSSSRPQHQLPFQELASVIAEAQNLQEKTSAFRVLAPKQLTLTILMIHVISKTRQNCNGLSPS